MKRTIQFLIIFSSYLFAQLPNLVVTTGGFSPSTIAPGGLLTITATVKNTGVGNSTKSHLAFFISTTTTITDGTFVGCVSVEPLAANAISELKQIIIPIPTALASGNYYIGWKVDPWNEVIETAKNNVFYLPSSLLSITNNKIFSRHIPYPIIFVHGLNSNDQTWISLLTWLDLYGWSFGGRMDFCLNYDGNLSTSLLTNDIHDFTMLSNLNVGDYYTVNFDVNTNGTLYNNIYESNQAAIVKQGKALQAAIKHVLDKTGSDKVILVGHSMGGLASREYLQNPSNWQTDGKHHVAKLLTLGTPHGGSDQWTLAGLLTGIDGYSEAVRDLRWQYSNGYSGVYLFGGSENNISSIGFNNIDVNCNGLIGDNIIGLNQKNLPIDLVYTCIIGTGGLTGDGLVAASSANLNNYYNVSADTFLVDAIHTNLPKEIEVNINGLDEPTNFQQAYRIGLDTLYYGLITNQSQANNYTDDYDNYFVNVATKSSVNINVANIPVSQLSVEIYDQTYKSIFVKYSKSLSQIDTTVTLLQGKYYLVVQATPDIHSWWFPYSIKLHSTPITYVENSIMQTPERFRLNQNFPNPFNPSTSISFHIPSRSFVSMKVFDILGREVANLISEELPPGDHSIQWNASGFSSGTYFYRLQSGSYSETKKLIIIK
jgi:pimeloyl-ACP methyl ester carboxylesterase